MDFNPVEVFKIAQKLEENGIAFYKKAADFTKDLIIHDLFIELAGMEEKHHIFFSKMEKKIKECGYNDSEDIKAYLDKNFSPGIFNVNDSEKIGSELKTMLDIFQYALKKENLSVEFYTMILKSISNKETEKALHYIIEEEKGHAGIISEYIEKLTHKV